LPKNGTRAIEAVRKQARRQVAVRQRSTKRLWSAFQREPNDAHRNELVEAYQSLVRELVRKLGNRLPRNVDRGDLETAANMGLIAAIAAYDPERGLCFESYCEMRVRGALLDELRAQDWLPRPWRQRVEEHKRTVEALRSRLNRQPHDGEVAEAMELCLRDYQVLFSVGMPGAPSGVVSPKEPDESGQSLDVVADTRLDAPEERLTREEILRLVAQKLSDQEYRILYLKYWEDLPMREIGELLGLSESRICKIHSRLLERLKDRLRSHTPGD
jgi:RNA polymerase sigma factor for flagellar operon FliA